MRNRFIYFESVDSTNSYALKHALNLRDKTVICAGVQTQGRGQFDRIWQSDKQANVLMSYFLKLPKDGMFNPKVIAAIQKTLLHFGVNSVFKEPNDIYYHNQKLCGTLIETVYENNVIQYAVIGIGLNVNQTDFSSLNATSMYRITNQSYDRFDVMEKLVRNLDEAFA